MAVSCSHFTLGCARIQQGLQEEGREAGGCRVEDCGHITAGMRLSGERRCLSISAQGLPETQPGTQGGQGRAWHSEGRLALRDLLGAGSSVKMLFPRALSSSRSHGGGRHGPVLLPGKCPWAPSVWSCVNCDVLSKAPGPVDPRRSSRQSTCAPQGGRAVRAGTLQSGSPQGRPFKCLCCCRKQGCLVPP